MSATTTLTDARPGQAHGTRRATLLALTRVEMGRLLRHPAFLLGLALALLSGLRRGQESWGGQWYYLTQVSWTFAWMGTMAAAALVAGRERFLSEPDLFPATPLTPGDRVLATALALVGPTLVAGAAVALVAALNVADGGFGMGEPPHSRSIVPPALEWIQPVLLVTLAGVVGIALAQLRRGRLAVLVLLLFATFVGSYAVWMFADRPFRQLHPFMYPAYETKLPASFSPEGWTANDPPLIPPGEFNSTWRQVRFDTSALAWHLAYVGGLSLVGVWWARRAADRQEPSPAGSGAFATARVLAIVGLPFLIVGGVAQILTAGANP